MSKILETRIQNKIDSEVNWNNNSSFIPLAGEAIIYTVDKDHDRPRLKFGDGVTTVTELPFVICPDCENGGGDTPVVPDEPDQPGVISSIPQQVGTLTYTGNIQSPTWNHYDATKMQISGTTSAYTAGSYSAYFTPVEGYVWEDGSSDKKEVVWTINKAVPNVVVNPQSIVLTSTTPSVELTIETYEDANTVITTSIGSKINITPVPYADILTYTVTSGDIIEETTITIKVMSSLNYLEYTTTVNVKVESLPSKSLNDYSWEEIRQIAEDGQAKNYFKIGDIKQITFKDNSMAYDQGSLKITTAYAYIIGFDHNGSSNTIDFQLIKSSDVDDYLSDYDIPDPHVSLKDVALVNGLTYGFKPDTKPSFGMNVSDNTNNFGWANSTMRKDILGSTDVTDRPSGGTLHALLPDDLIAVMSPITIYTDNIGKHDLYAYTGDTSVDDSNNINLDVGGRIANSAKDDIGDWVLINTDSNITDPTIVTFAKGTESGGTFTTTKLVSNNCSVNYYGGAFITGITVTARGDYKFKGSYVWAFNIGTASKNKTISPSYYITPTEDCLPLLSAYEVTGQTTSDIFNTSEVTKQAQYQYYAEGNGRYKYSSRLSNNIPQGQPVVNWWTRSLDPTNTYNFCCINTEGELESKSSRYSLGLSPIFRIGTGDISGGGSSDVTRYTISNNLTNVTTTNNKTSVTANSSYIANLTPANDHTVSYVLVSMGGQDITTSVYSGGTINIPSVSGNVTIIASATKNAVEPEEPSETYEWSGTAEGQGDDILLESGELIYSDPGNEVLVSLNIDSLDNIEDFTVTRIYNNKVYYMYEGTEYSFDATQTEYRSNLDITVDGARGTAWKVEATLPDDAEVRDYVGSDFIQLQFASTYTWGVNRER